ncbi:hypothetical protein ACEUAI_20865 [Aeromonas veronii]
MSIREKMGALLESFGEPEVITREMILERSASIREISELCKQTEQFQRAGDQVADFIKVIDDDSQVEDRLVHAWIYLLNRMASAPFAIFADGAVILIMPIVAHYLPNAENEESLLGIR